MRPFTVSATSASSGAVTYAVVSGNATISGSTVTLTGIGPVVLSASQVAAGNYAAATASTTFTVGAATPTLTFATIPAETFGNAPFTVSATSASSGAVTYTVVSGNATISGSTVTLTGIGPVVLSASQVAAGNYAAATASTTFTVAAEVPTLAFANIPAKTFGNAPFTVSATSASAGAVTYSVISGPATIAGSTVTLTGSGQVVLGASQAANGNYAAATTSVTLNVATAVPVLTFAPIPPETFGNAPFTVSATSASSGAVTYAVTSGPATISGSTVTLTGSGLVTLSASQAASGNYGAGSATTSFTVSAAQPTLTFAPIATQTYGNPPLTVSATSASSGAVTYLVVSGPATISGSVVTFTGAGTVMLSASQVASGNYLAATASVSFTVQPESTTLTFAPIPAKTYGNAPFTVSATSASSGAVTYTVTSGPATISGSTVTITGAGTVTLGASQAASGGYAAANAATSFTVASNVTISPITPAGSTIAPGIQAFNATAVGGVTNTLTWTATGGSFVGNVWTSSNTAGTYTITATSVDEPSVKVTTTITVSAPVITTQPVSQNICTNATATLSVAANYAATYQWYLGSTAIAGATSPSYFIASAQPTIDAGDYTAKVSNPAGSVTSNVATLTVGSSITTNPASVSVYPTQTATFNVVATGKSPFTYQWYLVPSGGSNTAIAGATSSSYTTAAVTSANNGQGYLVIVKDSCGNPLTSTTATLTVLSGSAPPTITQQPSNATVAVNATTTFTVTATGTPTLTYQWYYQPVGSVTGTAISGATSTSYTVPSTSTNTSNDQDEYYVMITNGYGQAVSNKVTLAVGNGILLQVGNPQDQYVNPGSPATFAVTATSNLPLSYQWYMAAPGSSSFAAIPGATGASYTIASAATSQSGSVFYVVISNGVTANVTSNSASLFVGALASIPSCSTNWNTVGNAAALASGCGYQLVGATQNQQGAIVWPTLLATGNIQLSFTVNISNTSNPPADGFAVLLGDPSLGATLTSTGATGQGLGAEGIPGFVIAFDDYFNQGDPTVPYLGVGRGETALWENPYFYTNTGIPAIATYHTSITHTYVVSIVQGFMTVTMDGNQVFSGSVNVPPVAYLYVTASTGSLWEQVQISNISATVSTP